MNNQTTIDEFCSAEESFTTFIQATFTTEEERRLWNDYIPVEKLGEGAFGSVVAAIRLKDDLPVAIKTICKDKAKFEKLDDDSVCPTEVTSLEKVKYVDGAVQLIEWTETPDKIIIVQERPHNSIDLNEFLYNNGPLSESATKEIISQLIVIVNNLMDVNILHRDLKTENILVNEDTLRIKIIDFGITSEFFTLDQIFHDIIGTPSYMSPEFVIQKQYIAGPAMSWAVGLIALELLTGSNPFDSERDIKCKPIRIPSNVSPECKNFISGCLSRGQMYRLPFNSLDTHPWLQLEINPFPINYVPNDLYDGCNRVELTRPTSTNNLRHSLEDQAELGKHSNTLFVHSRTSR